MIGSGGSALIGKLLGEKNNIKANEMFSLSFYFSLILGAILTIIGEALLEPSMRLLEADGVLLEQALIYGRIFILGTIPYAIQIEFQNLYVTAEKPKIGFLVTLISGLINIGLDALFIIAFSMDAMGAAIATISAQYIGAIISIIYFSKKNKSLLKLGKNHLYLKDLLRVCLNGISELLSNISISIVGLLYNNQLLRYAGEKGVSAYGVLMYVSFIYIAIFIGYIVGIAPVISYHYGAKNKEELSSLFQKSMILIAVTSVVQVLIAELLGGFFARAYVGYDTELLELTKRAFFIYSFNFLICGFNLFPKLFY